MVKRCLNPVKIHRNWTVGDINGRKCLKGACDGCGGEPGTRVAQQREADESATLVPGGELSMGGGDLRAVRKPPLK